MAYQKDISAVLGLSVSTVSKALKGYPDISEETKRKVLKSERKTLMKGRPRKEMRLPKHLMLRLRKMHRQRRTVRPQTLLWPERHETQRPGKITSRNREKTKTRYIRLIPINDLLSELNSRKQRLSLQKSRLLKSFQECSRRRHLNRRGDALCVR